MIQGKSGWMRKTVAALVVLGAAAAAEAGTISFSGEGADSREIGATVAWQMVNQSGDYRLEICVTNDTAYDVTRASSELLTGLVFEIDGLASGITLNSGSTDQLVSIVNNSGNSNDYAAAASGTSDLATQWGSSMSGGLVDLDWQGSSSDGPNYSIIGAGNNEQSSPFKAFYTNLNSSAFPSNHEPLVYETYFYFDHADFDADYRLGQFTLHRVDFNTDRNINLVPLPPAAWMGLGLLGVLGVARMRRRRRALGS
jgi:hypothetical protein